MIFTATLADRSIRGHFFLEDVECEEAGMRRSHCWLNQQRSSLPYNLPIPSKIRIDAQYRIYRDGPDNWTLCGIRSAEVIE